MPSWEADPQALPRRSGGAPSPDHPGKTKGKDGNGAGGVHCDGRSRRYRADRIYIGFAEGRSGLVRSDVDQADIGILGKRDDPGNTVDIDAGRLSAQVAEVYPGDKILGNRNVEYLDGRADFENMKIGCGITGGGERVVRELDD